MLSGTGPVLFPRITVLVAYTLSNAEYIGSWTKVKEYLHQYLCPEPEAVKFNLIFLFENIEFFILRSKFQIFRFAHIQVDVFIEFCDFITISFRN